MDQSLKGLHFLEGIMHLCENDMEALTVVVAIILAKITQVHQLLTRHKKRGFKFGDIVFDIGGKCRSARCFHHHAGRKGVCNSLFYMIFLGKEGVATLRIK